MVDTRSGKSTAPQSEAEQARIAATLRERKKKKELLRQAKMKAIEEEQAVKKKKLEEELRRLQQEEEKKKVAEEEVAAEEEEEEEEPLERRCTGGRGESGGTKEEDPWIDKKISEWVANLSLGEEKEVMLYVTQEEKDAVVREFEAMTNPLDRQALENEKKLEWKLRLAREKKRREEASRMAKEMEKVHSCRREVEARQDIQAKLDKILSSIEILGQAWTEQQLTSQGQDMALHSVRLGFRDFARDIVTHMGSQFQRLKEGAEKYCTGALEGAKAIAAAETEARPRKEPVKLKFRDAYGGTHEENFDNWEASVNSYVYLQHIVQNEQVLVAFHALKDEAASFARSLACAASCENNMVAYSKVTTLPQFLKLLRERFADLKRGVKASDKLQTIHSRQWRSARALKADMDELLAVPDHGVTEAQMVQLFYRAMPEPLRGHFFDKSQQPTMTYDALSREVVLYEAKSMPVSTFWHKGKMWKGRTISSHVRAKDHMILTLEEGGTEWGLEEEDGGVDQGRTYAAVAAGGRPQGRGGQGQRGQAYGGRGQGAQGVGSQKGRQEGGRGQGPLPNRQGS
ncbi:hypothetical protein CBR_g30432 [Chara braunii]|uniref:Uncharacterized protein n=1 Tax=Chara braunii TaxID=69332 RepID=A0A388LCP9_CHABU|nr:hypothetical protein CBR_g30432 [Chara braunii]|eukprot:GBG80066.1 hypothetical protein CBR_g30432 [Chara braunii]